MATVRCVLIVFISVDIVYTRVAGNITHLKVIKGDSVNLPCNFRDHGLKNNNRVIWKKDDVTVISIGDRILGSYRNKADIEGQKYGENVLKIRRTTAADAGYYTCSINSVDNLSQVKLTIQFRPTFHGTSGDQTVLEGSTVRLKCPVKGVPTPTVKWYRTTAELTQESNGLGTGIGIVGEWLEIRNVSRYARGTYTCEAFNSVGNGRLSMMLDVQFPPFVEVIEKNVTVNRSENSVTLMCAIQSNPLPNGTTAWLFKNQPITKGSYQYEPFHEDMTEYNTRFLILKISTRQLAAENFEAEAYTCQAHNSIGEGAAVNVTLIEP